MWARTVEVMLALWLAASPFIFGHSPDEASLWWNDFATAFLILVFSLVSFWGRASHAHLLNVLVGLWLCGFGYVNGEPPSPAAQNDLILGLLLLMLAIIPSHATMPPEEWRPQEA